jgi:hypothetical protein
MAGVTTYPVVSIYSGTCLNLSVSGYRRNLRGKLARLREPRSELRKFSSTNATAASASAHLHGLSATEENRREAEAKN